MSYLEDWAVPPTFEMPRYLLRAIKAKAITAQEAYLILECRRMHQEQEFVELPDHLHPAAQNLYFLDRRAWPTVM